MNTSSTSRRLVVAALTSLLLGAVAYQALPGHATTPPTTHLAAARSDRPPIIQLPPPRAFVRVIDNAYLPFVPGSRWVYGGETPDGRERIVVRVLERTKRIEGIPATVVRDTVRLDGEIIEDTFDWYGQDRRGNVWYLGEFSRAYENGEVVSTEGSWEAGVDGARAGIVMFGHPRAGLSYRQEYYAGHAEDEGKVLTVSTRAATAAGRFRDVLMTEDTTPLEADIAELKFYAPGVGLVLEFDLSPEPGRTELLRMDLPGR